MAENDQPTLLSDERIAEIRWFLANLRAIGKPVDAPILDCVDDLLAEIDRLRRRIEAVEHNAGQFQKERDALLNQRWSDDIPPGGYVCATCGEPVESEPCPEHAPEVISEQVALNAKIAEAARNWKRARIATKEAYRLCAEGSKDITSVIYFSEWDRENHLRDELLKVIGDVDSHVEKEPDSNGL